ncbi:predicted protein [Nematostella vectensis]|uniref:Tropomyosin n=1 Tax=Nematostella vectensis TaxID=45351 RepID=A7SC63_NEMVE|nr:tropomyosin alpha-4 chain [Nematostella vectensis]EDO38704.1 predicted protein [Nematostella vectensis]|eukprot:XP_001630767.1 predicted protein [Nematostella vectensis]
MASAEHLTKVKAKLQAIKEKIDETEDRELAAMEKLREAEERFEKAEGEAESFKRRIQLIEAESRRVKELSQKKDHELEEMHKRSKEEENLCKTLEVTDRESDEKMRELEDALEEAIELDKSTADKLAEVELKIKVVQGELEKAVERGDRAEMMCEHLMNDFTGTSEVLRDLEVKDAAASEREIDNEDKIEFIQENLKQMVYRYEEAERKAPPLEMLLDQLVEDLELYRLKRKQVDEEMKAMGELVEQVTIEAKPKPAAIFEQMAQQEQAGEEKAAEEEEEE